LSDEAGQGSKLGGKKETLGGGIRSTKLDNAGKKKSKFKGFQVT